MTTHTHPDECGAALPGADKVRRAPVTAEFNRVDPEPDEPDDRGEGPAEDAHGQEAAGAEDDDDAAADAVNGAAHDGGQDEGAREAEEETNGGSGDDQPVRSHQTYRVSNRQ